eukprot:scaffold404700_cov16-Prasinocladus_malaysianus.AAC.2
MHADLLLKGEVTQAKTGFSEVVAGTEVLRAATPVAVQVEPVKGAQAWRKERAHAAAGEGTCDEECHIQADLQGKDSAEGQGAANKAWRPECRCRDHGQPQGQEGEHCHLSTGQELRQNSDGPPMQTSTPPPRAEGDRSATERWEPQGVHHRHR